MNRVPEVEDGPHRTEKVGDAHGLRRPIRNWHREHERSLTVGQRAADRMRNGMGSWPFIAMFVAVMAVWIVLNVALIHFDPYPFILLNLLLSMIAGLQGAILLIAAKRQDAIAAALAQHDYETNLAAKEEIEQLMTVIREQHLMLSEIHRHTIAGRHEQTTND